MNFIQTFPCFGFSFRVLLVLFLLLLTCPFQYWVFIRLEAGPYNAGASARRQAASPGAAFPGRRQGRARACPLDAVDSVCSSPRGGSGPGVLYPQLCFKHIVLEGMPLLGLLGNSSSVQNKDLKCSKAVSALS